MKSNPFRAFGIGMILAVVAFGLAMPNSAEAAEVSSLWQGTSEDQVNVRNSPTTAAAVVAILPLGQPVAVQKWVSGEEVETQNNTWAQIGEGQYVYSARIHKSKPQGPPPLPGAPLSQGRWIDANLTQQVLTAYEGSQPVHVAVMSTGRPDYPTPRGTFTILRRVANETMTSAGLPWVKDYYRLENVRFTQYFTDLGAAIHEAWWKQEDAFGIPTSHACMGLPGQEAEWFWKWAGEGTPISIHD